MLAGLVLPRAHRHRTRLPPPQHRAAGPAPCFSAQALPLSVSHTILLGARGRLRAAPRAGEGALLAAGDAQPRRCRGTLRLSGFSLPSTTHARHSICRGGPTAGAESSTASRGAVLREMSGLHEGQP